MWGKAEMWWVEEYGVALEGPWLRHDLRDMELSKWRGSAKSDNVTGCQDIRLLGCIMFSQGLLHWCVCASSRRDAAPLSTAAVRVVGEA